MGIRTAIIAASVCMSGGVGVATGQGMRAVETRDIQLVYYSPTHAYLVPHLIRSFENAFAFHRKLFHYQSKEKVAILFEEFADSINGGSTALPRNVLDIGIAPPNYVFENRTTTWLSLSQYFGTGHSHITATATRAGSVTVAGVQAFMQFIGVIPDLVGLTQMNLLVPRFVTAGVQPVVVAVGGVSSPAAYPSVPRSVEPVIRNNDLRRMCS